MTSHETISIATINVLNNIYGYNHRTSEIFKKMTGDNAIICIQELRNDSLEETRKLMMKLNYNLITRDDIIHNDADTVGIAYNANIFDCLMTMEPNDCEAVIAKLRFKKDNSFITICSYHGDWGALKQASRLHEVSELNDILSTYVDNPVMFAGDFNAIPEEDTIRFLRGETGNDSNEYTYWVEAQDWKHHMDVSYAPFSTSLNAGIANITAGEHGIDTKYMPERRIDYIFTSGFAYGRRGGFTDVHTCDDNDFNILSDHRPVIADVII